MLALLIQSESDLAIVVDNGSTDRTAATATEHGARVLSEPRRGYGAACLTGIAGLDPRTDVVVFWDGDLSDHPEQMDRLVDPIITGEVDLVIGSRVLGQRQRGALTPQARAVAHLPLDDLVRSTLCTAFALHSNLILLHVGLSGVPSLQTLANHPASDGFGVLDRVLWTPHHVPRIV